MSSGVASDGRLVHFCHKKKYLFFGKPVNDSDFFLNKDFTLETLLWSSDTPLNKVILNYGGKFAEEIFGDGFITKRDQPECLVQVHLTFYSPLVTWCTISLTFNNCTLCPHCIYVFCIYLRTNSDLCHLHHKLIGFYNRGEKCLQRGTDWVFK
jgi:hypothetical protein